jgi:hypothetical protein
MLISKSLQSLAKVKPSSSASKPQASPAPFYKKTCHPLIGQLSHYVYGTPAILELWLSVTTIKQI